MEQTTLHDSASSIGTGAFLAAFGRALVALIVAAVVLLAGYSWKSAANMAAERGETLGTATAVEFVGRGLQMRMGSATEGIGGSLLITGLSQQRSALATREVSLRAEDYPLVRYDIMGASPGVQAYAVWLRSDNPGKVSAMPLAFNGDQAMTVALHEHPEWRGNIVGFGINVYGDLRGGVLEVAGLTLKPFSATAYLHSIWSHWTSAKYWDNVSINHMRSYTRDPFTTPAAALTLWALAGLLVLWLLGRVARPGHPAISTVVVLLLPWLVFDLLWQGRLSHQVQENAFQFGGKTPHEKQLASYDKDIYVYARQLRDEVLPEDPARIYLLHNSTGHNLIRLKTQFYLLPHNMYNYGVTPPDATYEAGDYILLLGNNPEVSFRPDTNTLAWGADQSLAVTPVHTHRMGSLYQVSNPTAGDAADAGATQDG